MIKQCPVLAQHMKENNNSFNLDWLEKHIPTCNHCQHIMRYVSGAIVPEILSELDGEDREDKTKRN